MRSQKGARDGVGQAPEGKAPLQSAAPSASGESVKLWVDAVNGQIDRCASEISRRSTTQQTIQAGSLSASTALAGVVVSGNSSPLLLLLIPIISVAFGYQWLDHHRTIQRLGEYIASSAEKALGLMLGSGKPVDFHFWETYIRRDHGRKRGRWAWSVPILGLFYGTSLLSLVVVFPSAILHPEKAATHGLSDVSIGVWPRLVWGIDLVIAVWAGLHTVFVFSGRERASAARSAA